MAGETVGVVFILCGAEFAGWDMQPEKITKITMTNRHNHMHFLAIEVSVFPCHM
jgi:hypothetical protein